MSISQPLRIQVLSLYKRLLRVASSWQAVDAADTSKERLYIKQEAASLIRSNSQLSDEVSIKQHLLEGEARLEMALHYKNPYPRPINIPQTVLPPVDARTKKMKGRQKMLESVKPVHIKSYETE